EEGEANGHFNMTYLAMSLAFFANAVSQRHGEVSRALLRPFWRHLLENEVPVAHITNGVHLPTWTAPQIARLLGAEGRPVRGEDFRTRAAEIDLGALWKARADAKRRLMRELIGRTERSYLARHDSPRLLAQIREEMERPALLIGFARRFAPYKRAALLFKDKERAARIFADEERPVRLLFAGKAHPDDRAGRDILKQIFELSRTEPYIGKVVFIENYDLALARQLIQGVDVWLNNPIRPLEASGTSGMKAAANGGLNLSILDGWWLEGYDGQNGWAIGREESSADQEHEDQFDSAHLLHLLEEVVVPLFYEQDAAGLPRRWLERVRRSLATIPAEFNTERMLAAYRDVAYLPAARNFAALGAGGARGARELAREHERLRRGFAQVKILGVRMVDPSALKAGDVLEVKAEVEHLELAPEDLRVEFVVGTLEGAPEALQGMAVVPLAPRAAPAGGAFEYEGTYTIPSSGTYGYGIRVRPRAAAAWDLALLNSVAWA
ncbi:MAG: alpha-glucan family phosphorylase, partial [Planctomycetes bacterium]|nr:alpha-glucan family phosphorylase [Planctomycetota bacterium]